MSDINARRRSVEAVPRIPRVVSRKALECELARLSARVTEAERQKEAAESFASLAAHELVAPLVMAEAYAAIVGARLDERDHADSLRDLEALARHAARVRLLVDALLQDARSDRHGLHARRVDLNAVVRDSISVLRPEIEAKQVAVRAGSLPAVDADETLLSSVITNLVLNALKFSPRLGGEIQINADEEPSMWRISVCSDAPTIPPEDRERIFEPFNCGRGERRLGGAGLGLALCRRIINRHGGRIGVVPAGANGVGNIFFFTLPA
jgi:signal transduction histidine kinase